jgi:hypothetical protein
MKRPNLWKVWPLMMALGFVCMADNTGLDQMTLRALTIVALTYSISLELCRPRETLKDFPGGTVIENNEQKG